MMKTFVNILFLIHLNVGFSQNLVPNPSFENYTICPTTSGQLDYANPWSNPTVWGSSDYYNACSSTFGTPSYCNCSSVFQFPVTGFAYAGLWCFDNSVANGREYIQTQLTSPLNPNGCYYVKFYVNLMNWAKYGCNNLALNFSVTQPLLTDGSSLMNLIPHVKDYNNRIITDTLNWKIIQGIYNAEGGGELYYYW